VIDGIWRGSPASFANRWPCRRGSRAAAATTIRHRLQVKQQLNAAGVAIALGATIFFWSSSFPAIRIGLDSYDPVELTLLRYIIASALLVPVALLRRPRLPRLANVPLIFVLGVLGIAAYHLLVSYGQQTISAGAAGVLSNTSPIFTALLGVAFLGERLRPIGWIGIIMAFVGAVMIAAARTRVFTSTSVGSWCCWPQAFGHSTS
jgi:drug/metabolite transporter (DMT)-like permease